MGIILLLDDSFIAFLLLSSLDLHEKNMTLIYKQTDDSGKAVVIYLHYRYRFKMFFPDCSHPESAIQEVIILYFPLLVTR